jgi:hypothetical protein
VSIVGGVAAAAGHGFCGSGRSAAQRVGERAVERGEGERVAELGRAGGDLRAALRERRMQV